VASDICRSAVPAPKYLPERRSTAFPHHYTPVCTLTTWHCPRCLPRAALLCAVQQSIDVSCQPGHPAAKFAALAHAGTDRLTDRRPTDT